MTCSLLKKAHTSTSIIFKHNTLSNLFNFVLLYLVKTFVSLELGKLCVPRFAILCLSTRKASQREQGANLTNEVDLVSAIRHSIAGVDEVLAWLSLNSHLSNTVFFIAYCCSTGSSYFQN